MWRLNVLSSLNKIKKQQDTTEMLVKFDLNIDVMTNLSLWNIKVI